MNNFKKLCSYFIIIEWSLKVKQRGGWDSANGQIPQSKYYKKDHNIAGVN